MKKVIISVVLSLFIIPSFAQISIGITGGYSLAGMHGLTTSDYMKNAHFSAWHAGAIMETKLVGNVYLQPQLLVSRKGGGYVYNNSANIYPYVKVAYHLTYLELPLNVIYKFKPNFYAGAGPYFARGLGGNARAIGRENVNPNENFPANYDINRDIVFKSKMPNSTGDKMYLRPWDIGLNFIAGYELKNGLFFNANYSLGF